MENRVTDVPKNLRDKREISIGQYKGLSPSGSRPEIIIVSLRSTKLSEMAFHLLDLFCLPSAHQHTNLQSFYCQC